MVESSRALHVLVVDDDLVRVVVRGDAMLVLHVSPPVVFARERLAALPGVGAAVLGAVVQAVPQVLVVDVAVQVRAGAEALSAAVMGALVRPLVVPLVVAGGE